MTMNETTTAAHSFLTFRLGDELFAASVDKVLEILEIPRITKVPESPAFLRGVINLRGNVLPVIDTRVKFRLPQIDDNINSCIIVLSVAIDNTPITIGAVVDAVQEVMEIEQKSVQPAPTVGSKYKSEFLEGMVKVKDHFIMMLNLDRVFSADEASILNDAAVQSETAQFQAPE
jgi:purine-binding chemotaxis protein CheW